MNKLGLIAGNGSFPIKVAQAARRRGVEVVAVAHIGETDPALERVCDHVRWIKVGELETMIAEFKRANVSRAAMAGGISRARQQNSFAPDARALRMMVRIGKLSDDAILRGLAEELETDGIEIFDPVPELLPDAIAEQGRLAGPEPTPAQMIDLQLAMGLLHTLGAFDVGQAVVVRNGVVAAVEAVEGTDAALRRAATLSGKGVVLAKGAKQSQDLRFDRPAIGPATVELLAEIGGSMVGLEAGRVMILDRETTLHLADLKGITVFGYAGA